MTPEEIRKLIKIMEFVEANSKKISENELREKFSKKEYTLYSRYCLGGAEPFAEDMGGNKIEGEGKHRLTQKGVRELYRLRQESRQIEISEKQTHFNKLLAIATSILALGVFLDYLQRGFNNQYATLQSGAGFLDIIALIIWYVGLVVLFLFGVRIIMSYKKVDKD